MALMNFATTKYNHHWGHYPQAEGTSLDQETPAQRSSIQDFLSLKVFQKDLEAAGTTATEKTMNIHPRRLMP